MFSVISVPWASPEHLRTPAVRGLRPLRPLDVPELPVSERVVRASDGSGGIATAAGGSAGSGPTPRPETRGPGRNIAGSTWPTDQCHDDRAPPLDDPLGVVLAIISVSATACLPSAGRRSAGVRP